MYSPITYNFKHTESDDARGSFNAFVDELFGHNAHLKIDAEPTEDSEKLIEVCIKLLFFSSTKQTDTNKIGFHDALSPTRSALHSPNNRKVL